MHRFLKKISILQVGHGETVTVRVPTHQDGKALYWEFATDYYDIGFGVFFEWVEPEDTQVNFYYFIHYPVSHYVYMGKRGHWTANYTRTSSFINMFPHLLT